MTQRPPSTPPSVQWEFVPPQDARCLWKRRLPNDHAIAVILAPWFWSLGIEKWSNGIALNIGPISVGIARIRRKAARKDGASPHQDPGA